MRRLWRWLTGKGARRPSRWNRWQFSPQVDAMREKVRAAYNGIPDPNVEIVEGDISTYTDPDGLEMISIHVTENMAHVPEAVAGVCSSCGCKIWFDPVLPKTTKLCINCGLERMEADGDPGKVVVSRAGLERVRQRLKGEGK